MRGRYEDGRLTGVEQLFESVSKGRGHFGGKIAFDRNGFVFVPQMGRIRDVRQGLDGFIYVITDDRDGRPTPVYRLEFVDRK